MAYEIKNLSLGTLKATTDYSAKQYYAVTASTIENYFKVGATTVSISPVGILQNNPDINEAGEIWTQGCVSKIVAGGAITVGKNFFVRGTGLAFSTGTVPSARSFIYGPVLETAASSGDIISVCFNSVGMTT